MLTPLQKKCLENFYIGKDNMEVTDINIRINSNHVYCNKGIVLHKDTDNNVISLSILNNYLCILECNYKGQYDITVVNKADLDIRQDQYLRIVNAVKSFIDFRNYLNF